MFRRIRKAGRGEEISERAVGGVPDFVSDEAELGGRLGRDDGGSFLAEMAGAGRRKAKRPRKKIAKPLIRKYPERGSNPHTLAGAGF